MTSRTIIGTGDLISGQVDIIAAPLAAYQNPVTVPGAIICHGSNKLAIDQTNPVLYGEYGVFDAVRQQYCVGIGDFEFNSWGSNAAIADIELMRVAMQTSNGYGPQAKPGKVALLGASMGACTALSYALAHPGNVSSVSLFIPAVGPLSNPGLAPAFQTAVKSGASYSESVDGPTHNPQNATYQANFPRGVPVKLWYSSGDTVAYSSQVVAFAAGVPNATAIQVSTTLDHGEDAIVAAPISDVMSFIAANLS